MLIADGVEARAHAARVIEGGGIVGFRTDTFYGLAVNPLNRDALRALNDLKGREGKPILVLVAARKDAARLAAIDSPLFAALAARHWPGALTIVCAAREGVPEELTAGTGTVGVRLPDDADVRALVAACGGALTATSANPAGRPPARTAAEVESYFGDRLALVVDGGETRAEHPSTVLDITRERPVFVREGAVPRHEIEDTIISHGATAPES